MGVDEDSRHLPVVDERNLAYEHPLYAPLLRVPGLSVAAASLDELLQWGTRNSLWVFPMATSCCGIELMAAAASRVDLDRMGTIVRASPRQADVMVVAGTITVKMAPRVKRLWDQMPEPKWCIAMGSCAISGDFYRDLYSVVPGIDTFLPVDVYIPGCPPNPEALMQGLLRLQEKIKLTRAHKPTRREVRPEELDVTRPSIARLGDPARDVTLSQQQEDAARHATEQDPDTEIDGAMRAAPEPPVFARDAGAADLEAILRAHGVTEMPKDAAPLVPVEKHVDLARALRAAGFDQFTYVVATHFPAKKTEPERFEVAYGLRSTGKGSRVASWRVRLETAQGIPTLVGLFAGADWQEREQYDLVGIRFEGHPDLRRLMLPGDWQGHPLRKDYAANTGCAPWR